MRALKVAAVVASLLGAGGPASASEFAMMETAEPITEGGFKLSGFPVMVDRDQAGNEAGFAVGLGYGLLHELDVEGQVARYGDGTVVGADLEWAAWREGRAALSLGGGLHAADLDGGGSATGVDGTLILSYFPTARLAFSAALDAVYDDVRGRGAGVPSSRFPTNGSYERYYAVPGARYVLTRNVELLGEVGMGLNGASDNYVAGGLSWYFR